MMINIQTLTAALAGWLLLAGAACATPILVYDQSGAVTGVNNLQVNNFFVDATILGDNVTYDQAFTNINRKPMFEGNISLALAASNSLAHFFNSSPAAPIEIPSTFGGGSLITKLVIPAYYIQLPGMSPNGWYVVYSSSSKQWMSATTTPGAALLIPIARDQTRQGVSLVAFTPGDPTPTQPTAVPAPSTGALLGLGIGIVLVTLRHRRGSRR